MEPVTGERQLRPQRLKAESGQRVALLGEEGQAVDEGRPHRPEELGRGDGGHGQHQTRRAEEAPHDRELEDAADRGGERQARREGDDERDPGELQQLEGELGARRAYGGLREVDDPSRPVDEDDADRGQRVQEPGDERLEQDRRRRPAVAPAGQEQLCVDEDERRHRHRDGGRSDAWAGGQHSRH